MSAQSLQAIVPFIVLTATAVVLLVVIGLRRHHATAVGVALTGLGLTFISALMAIASPPTKATPLIAVDGYALYYLALMCLAAMAVTLLFYGSLEGRHRRPEEAYLLILLATLGGGVLAASVNFASFFLGLELLSVSLFSLIAYPLSGAKSIEAGFKYLVLAGVSSAVLLLGIGLLYFALGGLGFGFVNAGFPAPGQVGFVTAVAGLGLVFVGMGFKLSLVPFHFWTPDVYEGAPAPVTAFLATVSKGAVFVALLRFVVTDPRALAGALRSAVLVIAVASMLIGNLLALRQENIKRLLAYSSIAHMGYLLVPLFAIGVLTVQAVGFYLAAYFVTTVAAFSVVGMLGDGDASGRLDSYRGLLWRRPLLGGGLAAVMFSLAGIPLTAGFIGKFYIFAAGMSMARWILVGSLVAGSVIGLYYYLRVVVVLADGPRRQAVNRDASGAAPLPVSGGVVLALLLVGLVWLGTYPAWLLHVIGSLRVFAG